MCSSRPISSLVCDSATSLVISSSRGLSGLDRSVPWVEEGAHQRADGGRIEERLAAHRGAARLDQVAVRNGLEHVAGGAGLQRFEAIRLDVVHGEDQHADVRTLPNDLARGLQSAASRHGDIEDGEIDVVTQAPLDRFDPV